MTACHVIQAGEREWLRVRCQVRVVAWEGDVCVVAGDTVSMMLVTVSLLARSDGCAVCSVTRVVSGCHFCRAVVRRNDCIGFTALSVISVRA